MSVKHQQTIHTDKQFRRSWSSCECGWRSKKYRNPAEAMLMWTDHLLKAITKNVNN